MKVVYWLNETDFTSLIFNKIHTMYMKVFLILITTLRSYGKLNRFLLFKSFRVPKERRQEPVVLLLVQFEKLNTKRHAKEDRIHEI